MNPSPQREIKGILSTDEAGIDPNIGRKSAIFSHQLQFHPVTGLPLFAKLELSLTGLCNRRCRFCPRSDPAFFPNVKEHMDEVMLQEMLEGLSTAGWKGTISLSGFGEPLLHPQILKVVRSIRIALPLARLEMVSNGDRLTVSLARELTEAGLDVMILSLYDGEHQLDKFAALRTEAGLSPDQMLLRVRYKPPEERHGLTISNRAGTVDLSYLGIEKLDTPKIHACYYPHYSIFVEYDGTVLLCCNDWAKKSGCGSLRDRGLMEIWHGHHLSKVRRALLAGNRSNGPCSDCDVNGTLMGGEHAAAWRSHYASNSCHSSAPLPG